MRTSMLWGNPQEPGKATPCNRESTLSKHELTMAFENEENQSKSENDEDYVGYCPNCYRAYNFDESCAAYIYVEEGDYLWTAENDGTLCMECHPDMQWINEFHGWTRNRELAVRPYSHKVPNASKLSAKEIMLLR